MQVPESRAPSKQNSSKADQASASRDRDNLDAIDLVCCWASACRFPPGYAISFPALTGKRRSLLRQRKKQGDVRILVILPQGACRLRVPLRAHARCMQANVRDCGHHDRVMRYDGALHGHRAPHRSANGIACRVVGPQAWAKRSIPIGHRH